MVYHCDAFSSTAGCMPGEKWEGTKKRIHTYPPYVRPGDTCLCGEHKVIRFYDPSNPKGAIITEIQTDTKEND